MVGGTRCLQRGVRVRFLEQPQPPAGLLLAVIASSTCICHHALMQALTLPSHGLIVHRGTASTRSQRAQSSDQWPMCNICHGGYRRRLGCSALQTPAQCSISELGHPPTSTHYRQYLSGVQIKDISFHTLSATFGKHPAHYRGGNNRILAS